MDVINKYLKDRFDQEQIDIIWRQTCIMGGAILATLIFAPPTSFIDIFVRIGIGVALTAGSIIRWFGVLEMERREKDKKRNGRSK